MLVAQTAIDDFRADVESAIYLKEQLLTRDVDRAFVAAGGRIIYAIDASILHHVFEREDNRRTASKKAKRAKPHAYRVFDGPRTDKTVCASGERAERKLGKVISNYLAEGFVWGEAERQHPLLILPGHDVEVGNLYSGIAFDFAMQTDKLSEAQNQAGDLQALQLQIKAGQAEKRADYKRILSKLFAILYAIERPHEQFHRFNRFTREQRLLKLTEASAHRTFDGDGFRLADGNHLFRWMTQPTTRWHEADEEGSELFWERRLSDRIGNPYRANDQRALAALDAMNKRFRASGIRVVLFTLNDAILEAATEYEPFEGEDEASGLKGMTFADVYLRHPRSLLLEIGAMTPAERGVQKAGADARTSWLDPMLEAVIGEKARAQGGEDGFALNLKSFRQLRSREVGEDGVLSDPQLGLLMVRNDAVHKRFIERWTSFVEDLCATHAAASSLARDAMRRALGLSEEQEYVVDLIDRIRAWVQQLTEESWDDFFNNAADTGLELIRASKGAEVPLVWPIPQLVVRGAGRRSEALKALWTVDDVKGRTSELHQTIAALRDETGFPNTYVQALGYGVIFSALGRWPLAKLLAQRAIQTVKTAPGAAGRRTPGEEIIDGREAHYLLAVASRLTKDIDTAKRALGAARTCFDAQRGDNLDPKLTGLRFDVETLEIEAAQLVALSDGKGSAKAIAPTALDGADRGRLLALGINALRSLEACKLCATPSISRQSAIALRSLYFLSLALLSEATTRKPSELAGDHFGGTEELAGYVASQEDDIGVVYTDRAWAPFRDRVLLQFAASVAGVALSDEMKLPYRDVIKQMGAPEHSLVTADKRLLRRLVDLKEPTASS